VALEEGHLILDAAQLVVAHLPERVRSPGTAQLLRAEKTAAMLRVEYLPASIGHRFTSSNGSALGTHGQSQVARHFPSEALMTDPPHPPGRRTEIRSGRISPMHLATAANVGPLLNTSQQRG
jgi:hypothetical protein